MVRAGWKFILRSLQKLLVTAVHQLGDFAADQIAGIGEDLHAFSVSAVFLDRGGDIVFAQEHAAGGAGSFNDAGFVVAGVVGGSAGWWLALTTLIGLFHTRIDEKAMRIINRTCGVLVMGCGMAVLIHLAIKFS